MTNIHKVKKIVLFKGQIETLGYFSEQLAKGFVQMGYEVYMFDFANSHQGINDLIWCCEKENKVMITFNFIGINDEDIFILSNGELFWNQREIVLFTGNYTPPHIFDKYINRIDDDYACFY